MRSIIKLTDSYTAIASHFITKGIKGYVERVITKNGINYGLVHNTNMGKMVTLDYDFPMCPLGGAKPFLHQKITTEFIINNAKCFILSDPGTGKSLSALWAVDYLLKHNIISNCLFIAPKTTLGATWEREIKTHFQLDYSMLTGSKEARIRKAADNSPIHIINPDGVTSLIGYNKLKDYDMIVYDEATALKNGNATRTKVFIKYIGKLKKQPRLVLMTGTPAAESPVDAYPLIKLVNDDYLKSKGIYTLGGFKGNTMVKITQFKWVANKGANEIIANAMQPSVRFTLDDAVDMPPIVTVNMVAVASTEQLTLLKQLKSEAEELEGVLDATNAGVLRSKMLQIFSGSVRLNDGSVRYLDCDARYEVLKEIIESMGNKPVLVFTLFKATQVHLKARLEQDFKGSKIECINGDVSLDERTRIVSEFEDGNVKVVLAHPRTTAHGLSFTRGNTCVFWSPVDSAELYVQGRGRARRLSSLKHNHDRFLIYHIFSSKLEMKIYSDLEHGKVRNMNEVLQMIKENI